MQAQVVKHNLHTIRVQNLSPIWLPREGKKSDKKPYVFNSGISCNTEVCVLFSVEDNSKENNIVGCPSDSENIRMRCEMGQS